MPFDPHIRACGAGQAWLLKIGHDPTRGKPRPPPPSPRSTARSHPRGEFVWSEPSEQVHQRVNDVEHAIGTYLYGCGAYEVMRYWETPEAKTRPAPHYERDHAWIRRAADKVVRPVPGDPRSADPRSFRPRRALVRQAEGRAAFFSWARIYPGVSTSRPPVRGLATRGSGISTRC